MENKFTKFKMKPETIDIYRSYKELFTMTKLGSSISILFCTNDLPDEWLIDVVKYKTKSGEVTYTYMINQNDLLDTIQTYEGHGFKKI